jgi:diadenosine tetraphosphate (Ap4A) HIT family hydrolase
MTDVPLVQREEFFGEMMRSHEAIQRALHPKKMNMCSLGNVVDHLHWHFFPRYANDPNFKNPPWLQMHLFETAPTTEAQIVELLDLIRSHLHL